MLFNYNYHSMILLSVVCTYKPVIYKCVFNIFWGHFCSLWLGTRVCVSQCHLAGKCKDYCENSCVTQNTINHQQENVFPICLQCWDFKPYSVSYDYSYEEVEMYGNFASKWKISHILIIFPVSTIISCFAFGL